MREISLCDAAVEGRKKRRSFNDKQVKDILLLMKTGVGDTFISKRYCISRGAIYAIRAKKTYKEYER